MIAVAVAAELLAAFERDGAHRDPRGDGLPRHFPRHPASPFTGAPPARRRGRGVLVGDGVIVARGAADGCLASTPLTRSSTCARDWCCRGRGHPRALPSGPRDRRPRHAPARLARTLCVPGKGPRGGPGVRGRGRCRLRVRARARGHHHRTRLRGPLRAPRWKRCSPRPARVGLRVTSWPRGVSDRILREDLFTFTAACLRRGAGRWPGAVARQRPDSGSRSFRGSPCRAATELLDSCAALLRDVAGRLLHLPHQREPRGDHDGSCGGSSTMPSTTSGPTTSTGSSASGSIFAHNVHPTSRRVRRPRPDREATVAHCPTSNAALGQRAVPAADAPRPRRPGGPGVRRRRGHRLLALQGGAPGIVGAASSRSFRILPDGSPSAAPGHGGRRLSPGAGGHRGRLRGRQGVRRPLAGPEPGTTLDVALRHAASPEDALAKTFALAGPADLGQTWVAGTPIRQQARRVEHPSPDR